MNWSIRKFFAAGYDAAENNRQEKQLPYNRRNSKDEDSLLTSYGRATLGQNCANLRRNDALVAGVLERFADNVVGTGIIPQAKTSDPEWNSLAEAFWGEWAKISDSRQRLNMRDLQRLVIQDRLTSGDTGFVITKGGQLQPIESNRIATPAKFENDNKVVEGVRVDPNTGITLGYYVFSRSKNGDIDKASNDYQYVLAKNFIFCMKPHRFDMVRGVPELAPVINSLKDIHAIQKATLKKAKMDAMSARAIYSDSAEGPGNLGPRNASKSVGGNAYETFEDGRTYYLRPGEKVESLASNTPSSVYVDFMEMSLRFVGSALSLPYEFFLLDFSEGSFSSSKAALLQTYRTFNDWQIWLSQCFLQRVWNWRIAKAIKNGEIPPAPITNGVSEWYKVEWAFPEFSWIDPQSEAQANLLEWQLCTNTITQMNRKKGRDVENVMTEKGEEMALAARIAAEINAKEGTALTWQDLISAQIPGQVVKAPSQKENK